MFKEFEIPGHFFSKILSIILALAQRVAPTLSHYRRTASSLIRMSQENLRQRSRILALMALAVASVLLPERAARMDAPYMAFLILPSLR
jgi:hypothetical protein